MALFRKKNTHPQQKDSFGSDDEIDIFEALDGETDLSAQEYPTQSYDDFEGADIEDDILGLNSMDEEPRPSKKPKKKNPIMFLAIGAIVVIGGGFLVFSTLNSSQESQEPAVDDEVNSRVEGSSEGIVVNEELGVTYEGNDNGAPVNGTGAILAFDHAYYVDRDGEKVLEHFNPDVRSYDDAFVQSHINKVPVGTTYSLQVTPLQVGVSYDVTLTLTIPGEEPVSYLKNVETMEKDGEYFVKTFTWDSI